MQYSGHKKRSAANLTIARAYHPPEEVDELPNEPNLHMFVSKSNLNREFLLVLIIPQQTRNVSTINEIRLYFAITAADRS